MSEKQRASERRLIDWGVASATLAGQTISGDLHLVKPLDKAVLVAVVDGLGHGGEAARAARAAIDVLSTYTSHDSLMLLVERCNEALRRTRGVVLSLAVIDGVEHSVTWLGVGDVAGVLLRADPTVAPSCESMVTRGGVVGYRMPHLRASIHSLAPGDTLVLATDGIQNEFSDFLKATTDPQRLADDILARFRKATDDALVFVACYRGP